MTKLNLITEGFLTNVSTSGLREIESDEVDTLLDLEGLSAVTTVSGDVINLKIDLGFRHSVDQLRYKTSPLTTSGLTIKYGIEENNLTTAPLLIQGGEIIVEPTASGFKFPRFFTLTHNITESGIVIDRLIVENTEEEIDFGEDGNLTGITITSPLTGGYSDVFEVPVFNSGTIPNDMFVTVDTSLSEKETFENLEIAPTITGTFQSVDPNNVPDTIPWEWGVFENITVNDDNELELVDPDAVQVGLTWNPSIASVWDWNTRGNGEVVLNDGRTVLVTIANLGEPTLSFVDPFNRMVSYANHSMMPDTYPFTSDPTNLDFLHFAYDGQDNIYWLRGVNTLGGAREIYKYEISSGTSSLVDTISTYNTNAGKGIVYYNGELYVLGGRSTPAGETNEGLSVIKYNLTSAVETSLADLPVLPSDHASFRGFEGYIYYHNSDGTSDLWRYDIEEDMWSLMPAKPSGNIRCMAVNIATREIWVVDGVDSSCGGSFNHRPFIRPFDHDNMTWGAQFVPNVCGNLNTTGGVIREFELVQQGAALYYKGTQTARFATEVLTAPPITVSGSWLSPVFLVRQGLATSGTGASQVVISGLDSFHRLIVDTFDNDNIKMTIDSSIIPDTFEVRASNQSPAGDNTIENFTTSGIDTTRHVVGSTGGLFLDQNEQGLEFNHTGDSDITASFLYINQAFATAGTMQYKIWWRPPAQKAAGSLQADRSAIYIGPFLDTINTGAVPIRNSDVLRRNNGDYLAIRLGNENDTSSFTEISVFKGGGAGSGAPSAGSDDYTIVATSDRYYEIVFIINWITGDYSLWFDGQDLGGGNVPLSSRLLLEPQHSVEIYSSSTGTGVSFTEYFKLLTINRLNLEARQDLAATPLHLEDPLYGLNGSLPFTPITSESAILPVADYLQARLVFQATNASDHRAASKVSFPPIIRLPEVNPGESKSVYLRYNFPPSNNLVQDQIFLKAYMATDKED